MGVAWEGEPIPLRPPCFSCGRVLDPGEDGLCDRCRADYQADMDAWEQEQRAAEETAEAARRSGSQP